MKRLPAISVLLALTLALAACQGATNQNNQPATGSAPVPNKGAGQNAEVRKISASDHAEYKAAIAAYDRGDYAAAAGPLHHAAERGNAEAQFRLGYLYQLGEGVSVDDAEAARWLRLAAEQGHADAQHGLGLLYATGSGVPLDRVAVERWYRAAAEQGHTLSLMGLGNRYKSRDKVEALKWYTIAAVLGDDQAKPHRAIMLSKTTDEEEAEADRRVEAWLADFRARQATANSGQIAASSAAPKSGTSATSQTESAEQDYAIGLAEDFVPGAGAASSASPSAEAAFRRGSEALERKDYAEALRWYQRGADQGNAKALFALGTMYVNGTAGRKDDAEGARLIRAAAEQGLAGAQSGLGVMYRAGVGVPQDYAQAAKWLRLAAEQSEPSAQSQLASMYGLGQGVRQDYAEAVRWFRSAAAQDYADAQYGLGFLYQTGHGVPQDDVEAVRWFRKAAGQGHAEAQDYLGAMYLKGWGVTQDLTAAAKWFRAAAEQGRSEAQHNLAGLYAGGHGVKLDVVEAYKWFSLALAQGQQESEEKLRLLSLYMNQSMIAEAERRAEEWRRAYRARQRG